ncbi:MAG: transporter [Ignavibacteria bacterium]|nr:transporter [Ignavibacteria bacterium]
MKYLSAVLILIIIICSDTRSCNSCGGGTSDLAVLSLDGLALFNIGVNRDEITGVWDKNGSWIKTKFSQSQYKISFNTAYRLNRHIQFAVSLPFQFNNSNIPGLKQNGSGLGDITVGGRFEIFHEFQPKKKGKKLLLDNTLPYLALTFGLNLPTGKSDETAENDVDITGKGFYSTTLGVSVTKSIVKSKFQVVGEFSWQHSFEKKYSSYFGKPITYEYRKQPGEKFNYALTANYIINSRHAVSLSAAGFFQGKYTLNGSTINNTAERNTNFILAYTFYPSIPFRITSSLKLGMPQDNFGVNAQGSTSFNINFTYYIPQ